MMQVMIRIPAMLGLLCIACAFGSAACGCAGGNPMIDRTSYGEVGGRARPVELYTLTNDTGAFVRITNYGAIITELHVPDFSGRLGDVVLGFDTVEEYVDHNPYFGAIAGRVANRIAGGRFEIDGEQYQLATNNGPNHLHGGLRGFDKVIWNAEPRRTSEGPALRLTYHSPDGEEGYPGAVDVTVDYIWTHANELKVVMQATSDAPTPVNLVHHSYWNLDGHDSGAILDHELTIEADRYTPTDSTFIPTGELAPVAGTPYDFRQPRPIGRDIGRLPPAGADNPGGYDINFVVRDAPGGEPAALRRVARVYGPASGRIMEIHADQPGVQFYSGNFLGGVDGKGGASYARYAGFCLETQAFPDAINHQGEHGWPNVVLRPGESYRHTMVHTFAAE
jgi:aldose 1-epimerase